MQELKAEIWEQEVEAEEKSYLLTAPNGLLSSVLDNSGRLFSGGTTSVIDQEKLPEAYPQASLVEAFSQLRVPLPR